MLHDHFYHRLDANLRMLRGGVTAKVAVPVADLAIYNDSAGEPDREFYDRTPAQADGWAKESLLRLERRASAPCSAPRPLQRRASGDDPGRKRPALRGDPCLAGPRAGAASGAMGARLR